MTQDELKRQLYALNTQYEQIMEHSAVLYVDAGTPGAYHFTDGRVVYGVRSALIHMHTLLRQAAEELEADA